MSVRAPSRVSGAVAGLGALLDKAGLTLGALVIFLVGIALSGVASAAELLPQPWVVVGHRCGFGDLEP